MKGRGGFCKGVWGRGCEISSSYWDCWIISSRGRALAGAMGEVLASIVGDRSRLPPRPARLTGNPIAPSLPARSARRRSGNHLPMRPDANHRVRSCQRMRASSTPRPLGSSTRVSGILGHPPSRVTTAQDRLFDICIRLAAVPARTVTTRLSGLRQPRAATRMPRDARSAPMGCNSQAVARERRGLHSVGVSECDCGLPTTAAAQ